MIKICRMKSLLAISPSFSNSVAAAASFNLYFHSRPSTLLRKRTNINPSKNPNFYPAIFSVNSVGNYANVESSSSSQSRGLCTDGRSSGEIHVIVGPMFAGKTTTLLKRMKSESSNGRFDWYPSLLAFIVILVVKFVNFADLVNQLLRFCNRLFFFSNWPANFHQREINFWAVLDLEGCRIDSKHPMVPPVTCCGRSLSLESYTSVQKLGFDAILSLKVGLIVTIEISPDFRVT